MRDQKLAPHDALCGVLAAGGRLHCGCKKEVDVSLNGVMGGDSKR